MGFSRQEYWSGLPFLSPEVLSNPGMKPGSPALQADSLPSELQRRSNIHTCTYTFMHKHYYKKKSFSDVCSFIKSKLEIFWWRQKCIWIVWARFPGKDWDTNLHKLRSALINISDRTREARLRKRRTVQFQIRSSKTHIHHQNYSPWTTSKVLELPKEGVTGGWLLLAQFAQIALWQFPGRLHSEQQVANTPRKWGNAFWNEVGGTL